MSNHLASVSGGAAGSLYAAIKNNIIGSILFDISLLQLIEICLYAFLGGILGYFGKMFAMWLRGKIIKKHK